jgi:phage terminase large subunit GpA-like protein
MAIRGVETGEIFRQPKAIDPGRKSKAARYGLQVYPVGTEKAKDLIIGFGEHGGRLRLSERNAAGSIVTGRGPGRMHWYREIRGDFYAQITSEVKAPMKGRPRNRLYWTVKQGVRNEALDCCGYALHASRKVKVNLFTEAQWLEREQRLRQPDLAGLAARSAPAPVTDDSADIENDSEIETETETETAAPPAPAPRPAAAPSALDRLRARLPGAGQNNDSAGATTGTFL